MADERTEAPTPKRRREARRRGQTGRSAELTSAVVLLAGLIGLRLLFGVMHDRLGGLIVGSVASLGTLDRNAPPYSGMDVAGPLVSIVLPLLGFITVAAIGAAALQGGLLFSPGLLAPKAERISPLAGAKRLFSAQGLMQLLRTLGKFLVVGAVAYTVVNSHLGELLHFGSLTLPAAMGETLSIAWEIAFKSALAILVVGVLDWLWGRRRFLNSIRMTKQEVKEELRESEVDPQVRARLRRRREELVREMLKNVRTADVVVTNPTHFAVALKYDPVGMSAPTVVAKGVDFLAMRLREAASEAHVPIVANPPLARSLYRSVPVGQQIPAELYTAVAEVLAFVFRLRALRQQGPLPTATARA